MKKITTFLALRAGIAASLCVSFLAYPQMRISSMAPVAVADAKTESEIKSEAASYSKALLAIGGITTMKLDSADGLKQADAIVDRERPNLKFFRSKLIAMAIGDSTFASGVKKVASNEKAAEAFLKSLIADRKAVLKVDGARSLQTRIARSIELDATTLRQAGERLKAAAEAFKPINQPEDARNSESPNGFNYIKVGENKMAPFGPPVAAAPILIDPVTIITGIALAAAVIVATAFAVTAILNLYENTFTEAGRDRVAECQSDADDRLAACVAAANRQAFPFNLPLLAVCNAQWLLSQAKCQVA